MPFLEYSDHCIYCNKIMIKLSLQKNLRYVESHAEQNKDKYLLLLHASSKILRTLYIKVVHLTIKKQCFCKQVWFAIFYAVWTQILQEY